MLVNKYLNFIEKGTQYLNGLGGIGMGWFYNLRILRKLQIVGAIIIICGLILTCFSIYMLNNMKSSAENIYLTMGNSLSQVFRIHSDIESIGHFVRESTMYGADHTQDIQNILSSADINLDNLRKTVKLDTLTEFTQKWLKTRELIKAYLKNPSAYAGDQSINNRVTSTASYLGFMEEDLKRNGTDKIRKTTETAWFYMGFLLLLAAISFGIAAFLGTITIATIVKPLQNLRDAIVQLSEGKLYIKDQSNANKDEIGITIDTFNQCIFSLRELIIGVYDVTEKLGYTIGELSPKVHLSGEAASKVTATIQELTCGTQEQAKAADVAAGIIHHVVQRIEGVNQETQLIAGYSTKVIAEAEHGEENTQRILTQMNNLATASNRAGTIIQELQQRSKVIGSITSNIREMTEQTQLLSLNASIEAARAGEYGRGFAVVAEQVGKLSKRSSESVQEIESALGGIQQLIDSTVQVIQENVQIANQGCDVITDTSCRFNEIFASITKVAEEITLVAKETQTLTEANRKAIEAIDTIASISEETASSSEEVLTTVENQGANVSEVAKGMNELLSTSRNLGHAIAKFQI
jgi:methyl-accepting chemotaxis protein